MLCIMQVEAIIKSVKEDDEDEYDENKMKENTAITNGQPNGQQLSGQQQTGQTSNGPSVEVVEPSSPGVEGGVTGGGGALTTTMGGRKISTFNTSTLSNKMANVKVSLDR